MLKEIEIPVEVDAATYAWLLKYSEDQERDEHGRWEKVEKYSDDQPRDERGRWSAVPGAGTHHSKPDQHKPGPVNLKPTKERAFHGQPIATKIKLTNDETKAIGEAVITQHLMRQGFKDAGWRGEGMKDAWNAGEVVPREEWDKITGSKGGNNFPIDVYADHIAVEIKAGVVSNGKSAQQWRVKYGAEPAYMKDWSPRDKEAWRTARERDILRYKEKGRQWLEKDCGKKVSAVTYTAIINPDTRHVDIYRFKGYHLRLGWMSNQDAYVKSYKY